MSLKMLGFVKLERIAELKKKWKSRITYVNTICLLSVLISLGFTIGFRNYSAITLL